jgi:hypothetical protein
MALVMFYFFFAILSGSREHFWPVGSYFQAMWLHWICLGVVVGMSIFGSVIFAAPSSTTTICFVVVAGIMFVGGHLDRVAIQIAGARGAILYVIYYLIPHLEWYDVRDYVVHDWGLINWGAWIGATLYGCLYAFFFLGCAWLAFRRRPLTV